MRETIIKQLLSDVAKKEQLKNHNYEFATGLNKKDGFLSSMFHVKLTGETEDEKKLLLNLLIKFAPINEKFRDEVPIREAFRREILFYDTFVPKMNDLLLKSNLQPLDFVIKSFAHSYELGHEAIALDNLKYKGYELWDSKKPMNHEHIKCVLENYGKFHATGFALKYTDKEFYAKETKSIDVMMSAVNKRDDFINFSENQCDVVAAGLDSTVDGKLIEALKIYKNGIRSFFKRNSYEDDRYFTMLHGDCWCNNIMFKYIDESHKMKPENMMFLDWQLSWNGPPVMDVTYFFYSNASSEMYDKLEEYKDIYYRSLSKQLKQLGHDSSKIFPREEFEKQLKEFGRFGMSMSLGILYMRLFKNEMKDHEDLKDSEETLFDQFSCKQGQDLTEYYTLTNALLRHCFQNGYF